MRCILSFVVFLLPLLISAQNNDDVYKVTYNQLNNGQEVSPATTIYYSDSLVYLSQPDVKIQHFSDLKKKQNISTLVYDNKVYGLLLPFSELPVPNFDESKNMEIMGYDCSYASYSYFSNSIEVWFTDKTMAKGSPYGRFLPKANVLVMRIIINGNREVVIDKIEKDNNYDLVCNYNDSTIVVSDAEFEEIKINSRYNKMVIFENEVVNFDPSITPQQEKDLEINNTYHVSKGSVILKKIKLSPKLQNSECVFAKLTCKSNGDAYDRTGSVFIISEMDDSLISVLDAYLYGLDKLPVYYDNNNVEYQGIVKNDTYAPPIELMRFFTPFGVGHFNEMREINNYPWADEVVYKQDVTSLLPNDKDELWIGVFIGNYDSGGHVVSLDLDFHPTSESADNNKIERYVQPLFSTVNTLEMLGQNYGRLFQNDTLEVKFTIDDDINSLRLLYTSTGHGGWGGGDEFNPKLNQIFIDGKEIFNIVPWRTDCATYRLLNPASGNFGNGISSSDLSRSNWCPAMLTPPYVIPLNNLEKGSHILEVVIDQGDDEGSSFSHWEVTGVLVGEK